MGAPEASSRPLRNRSAARFGAGHAATGASRATIVAPGVGGIAVLRVIAAMSGVAVARRTRLALALHRTRRTGVQAQRGGGLEAGHVADRDLLLEQLADVAKQA